MTKTKISVKDMTQCALFTVLIIVGAFIKVPIPVCPFTLQFFFTTMAGIILGAKKGAISVALYTVLGLVGLPVFAEGGGFRYILKQTLYCRIFLFWERHLQQVILDMPVQWQIIRCMMVFMEMTLQRHLCMDRPLWEMHLHAQLH